MPFTVPRRGKRTSSLPAAGTGMPLPAAGRRGRWLATSPQAVVEEAPALPIVPADSRRPAAVRGRPPAACRCRRAEVGGRRQQRSAAAASDCGHGRRLAASTVVEAPASPIVLAGSRWPAAVQQPAAASRRCRRRSATAAIGADLAAGAGHCRRPAAASVGRCRLPSPRDWQRSAAVTCLVQPGPWQ